MAGGEGDWSSLMRSGPNGFVNVLMSLVGLMDVSALPSWREALADVSWVLREVGAASTKAAR